MNPITQARLGWRQLVRAQYDDGEWNAVVRQNEATRADTQPNTPVDSPRNSPPGSPRQQPLLGSRSNSSTATTLQVMPPQAEAQLPSSRAAEVHAVYGSHIHTNDNRYNTNTASSENKAHQSLGHSPRSNNRQ